MNILALISLSGFIWYGVYILIKIGIPKSFSDSVNRLHKKDQLLFTWFSYNVGIPMEIMAAVGFWSEQTTIWQSLAILLAGVFMCLVGHTPVTPSNRKDFFVLHNIFSGLAILGAFIYIYLRTGDWINVLIFAVLSLIYAIFIRWKTLTFVEFFAVVLIYWKLIF